MITQELEPRLKPQACPFCGAPQDIMVNGHEFLKDDPTKVVLLPDYGYSFCNCRNVFYTAWENMEQALYNEDYERKYTDEKLKRIYENSAKAYLPLIQKSTLGKKLLEIGAVNPYFLDACKLAGFETLALDIISHNFEGHKNITGNFEDLIPGPVKHDAIWASHIFEHFKDPLYAAQKCFDILNPSGVLFVAMPDPWFVDWRDPYSWGHWHIREHHIMWDMESFCAEMEKIGFKTILKKRNFDMGFICIGDMHLMFQRPE